MAESKDVKDVKDVKDGGQFVDENAGDGPGYDNVRGTVEFAPLHRKLKSRHLQMIAIGGKYSD